jgi:hypothetical protein
MSYYRLKIEEMANGTKHYYVEKAVLVTTKTWIQRQWLEWKTYSGPFLDEAVAMQAIAKFKAEDEILDGLTVTKITYKDID